MVNYLLIPVKIRFDLLQVTYYRIHKRLLLLLWIFAFKLIL